MIIMRALRSRTSISTAESNSSKSAEADASSTKNINQKRDTISEDEKQMVIPQPCNQNKLSMKKVEKNESETFDNIEDHAGLNSDSDEESSSSSFQLQAPVFGLSELALSAVSEPTEEVASIVRPKINSQGAGAPRKRIRNPPKEPVICPVCGQNFTRRAHLVRHALLHTGEKPFQCPKCDQSFNRKDHLTSHLRNHSAAMKSSRKNAGLEAKNNRNEGSLQTSFGFKIMTCTFCDKKFTQAHLYNAHIATHQSESVEDDGSDGVGDDIDVDDERNVAEKHVRMTRRTAKLRADDSDDDESRSSELEIDDDQAAEDIMETDEQTLEDEDDEEVEVTEDGELDVDEESEDEEAESNQNSVQEALKKFECVVCARVYKEQRSLRRHYKTHKRNFICRFCGIKMASAGSLMRHNLLHTGERPYECDLCQRRFSRKDALKAHRAAHDRDDYKAKSSLERPHTCKICAASYTKVYNLVRHMKQYHPQITRQVPTLQKIKQVVQPLQSTRVHFVAADDPMKCGNCRKEFTTSSALSTHIWYHNQDKKHVCNICHHGFTYPSDLIRHLNTHRHSGRRIMSRTQLAAQSRIAQAKLQRKAPPVQLQRAAPIHNSYMMNGVRYYPCSLCKQVFNHRSNRSRHMKLIHKANQYEANQQLQQKQISPRSNVAPAVNIIPARRFIAASIPTKIRTQVTTTGLKMLLKKPEMPSADDPVPNFNGMWRCKYCFKVFNKIYNFKIHMRTHNKQFACLVCGMKTASQGDLTLHIRTHTGEKPFKCELCEWRFCRRSALTVHYRRHHGPEAKIRRQYNPQRLTPNLKACVETAVKLAPSENANRNSILKTMLENYPCKDEDTPQEEQEMPSKPPKHKVLPPPPPLIRYPFASSSVAASPSRQEGAKVESFEVMILCKPCGTLISGKDNYVDHMLQQHGTAMAVTAPPKIQQPQRNPFPFKKPSQPPSLQRRPPVFQPTQPPSQKRLPSIVCRQCGELWSSKHDLTVHSLVTHHTNTCGICRKICSTIGFLSRHYMYCHPDVKNAAEEARVIMIQSTSGKIQPEQSYDDNGHAENILVPEVVIKEEAVDQKAYEDDDDDDLTFTPESLLEQKMDPIHDSTISEQLSEGMYQCGLCSKAFKDKKALADHKWYHSREAIHPCSMCPRRFKLKNDLIRHYRRHLQERPHGCPENGCDSRFYQKADLGRHLVKVHHRLQKLPCACEFCPARFSQYSTLIRHVRGAHPGEDVSPILELEAQQKQNSEADKETLEDSSFVEVDEDFQNQQNEKDYSFELQQLEIETCNEEDYENDPEVDLDQIQSEPSSSTQKNKGQQDEIYKCETCDKTFDDRQKYIYHRYYHTRELRYPCQYCDEKFKIKGHLERHVRTYHSQNSPPKQILRCSVKGCTRKFLRDYDLSNHLHNVHKKSPIMPEGDEYVEENENAELNDGNYDEQDSVMEYEAMQQDEEGDFGEDEEMQVQGSSLLQPCLSKLEEYTNEAGELFCKPCNKHFKDLKTLQSHVYYHQRESKHPCQHCGARFKQKSDLRRHIGIHHNPDKKRDCISCPNCNRSFTDERYLRIHLNKSCEGKSVVFDEENESSSHREFDNSYYDDDDDGPQEQEGMEDDAEYEEDGSQQDHQDQDEWEEEPNPLMFVASDMQMDNGEEDPEYGEEEQEEEEEYSSVTKLQRFDCDLCGAFFSRSNELILHKRQHAQEAATASASSKKKSKTFECNKCGMSFLQKGELTQHLQQYHLDELPVYQCQFCPKFFYVKKSLDTHRRRHHSHLLTLFPCKLCNAKFTQEQYLVSHMKSHHTH